MIDTSVLEKCARRFQSESPVVAVWGFGSAFSGRMRLESDVDFAILYEMGHEVDRKQQGQLARDLGLLLHRPVDLGEVTTRNLVFACQAIRSGTMLFCRDVAAASEFTGRLFSLYADFKQDRNVVEAAYCAG